MNGWVNVSFAWGQAYGLQKGECCPAAATFCLGSGPPGVEGEWVLAALDESSVPCVGLRWPRVTHP